MSHFALGLLLVLVACETRRASDDARDARAAGETDAGGHDATALEPGDGGGDGGGDAGNEPPGFDADPALEPSYTLTAPESVAPGMLFTVAVRADAPVTRALGLCAGGSEVATLRVYRGRGSASLRLHEAGEVSITLCDAAESPVRRVRVEDRPVRELSGTLDPEDARWDSSDDVRVSGDLTVPESVTLVIEAGARVRLRSRAAIVVRGALEVNGSEERPVIFTAEPVSDAAAAPPAWGGLIFRPGSRGQLRFAWLNSGGGDDTRTFGHSSSQPVIAAEQAELSLHSSGIVDNPGKALGTADMQLTLDDVLISRCDTGGQLNATALTMRGSHVLEIPDSDGRLDDDDNDGLYLSGAFADDTGALVESSITDSVFAVGEDDGIDHNGALLRVERTWIEGFHHEGLAASNANRVTLVDCVVRGCEHGIEAGYGAPEVIVERCFVTDNAYGLRVGDSYDWETAARMRVTHTVSVGNHRGNAHNFVLSLMAPLPDGLEVRCSMVDDPAFDGLDGNLPAVPEAAAWAATCDPRLDRLDEAICSDAELGPMHCE